MRDRLIALIRKKSCLYAPCDGGCGGCGNVEMFDDDIESLADLLLANGVIVQTPSEDVVEVVRCKNCKHWKPMDDGISWNNKGRTDGQCEILWQTHNAERHLTNDEHFCGYGERKEQE